MSPISLFSPLSRGLALGLALASASHARADDTPRAVHDFRCELDSLDVQQALGRLDWSVKCGFISQDTRDFYATIMNMGTQFEGLPQYPTYLEVKENGERVQYAAPTTTDAACPDAGKVELSTALCRASCYDGSQKVLFTTGYLPIKTADERSEPKVVTVAPKSTLANIDFASDAVGAYTQSLLPADNPMEELTFASGGKLIVTSNHPLVDSKGRFVQAGKLRVGQAALRADGSADKVVSKRSFVMHGKVYNLAPANRELASNLVVAHGYLNGSSWIQNIVLDRHQRHVLNKKIVDAALAD